MMNAVRQIRTENLAWIHIASPRDQDIKYLRETYSFHPLDLQDCLTVNQHPKVEIHDTYVYLILMFPFYDRRERKILASELDFFIGKDYVITVSDGKSLQSDVLFEECLKSPSSRERILQGSSEHLLYTILHRLQEGIFPMLDHVSEDLLGIENQIFTNSEKRMVHDILLIKRNIVNFRRIMNAHRSTIKKLMAVKRRDVFALSPELFEYFENILDRSKDIWEILEIQKETINAFQETNDALISFKLNDTLKMLTAISASIFPATLVATLFSVRAIHMPIVDNVYGFWIILVLVAAVGFGFFTFFKKKDWL